MSDSIQEVKNELAAIAKSIPAVRGVSELRPLFYRLEAIAKQFPNDIDIQLAVGDIKQSMVSESGRLGVRQPTEPPAKQHAQPPYPVPPVQADGEFATAVMLALPGRGTPLAAPPQAPVFPPIPPLTPPPPPPMPGAAAAKGGQWILWAGLGLLAVAAAGGGVWFAVRQKTAAMIAVHIKTSPGGASVLIDGEARCTSNCDLLLDPGVHEVRANLDGYESAASSLALRSGQPASPGEIALIPLAQNLKIVSDLGPGKILLDDGPAAAAGKNDYSAEKIPAGRHRVKVTGPDREAAFSFEISPGKAPVVTGTVTTRNALAVLVATLGRRARLVTSSGPWKLMVNGVLEGEAGPDGVDLKNLKEGENEVVLGEGAEERKIKATFGTAPALTAFLKEATDAGILTVSTIEDDVRVFVNGKERPAKTAGGQLRIRTIGPVTVRVVKDGFEEPLPKSVELKKDADARMNFTLTAKAGAKPEAIPARPKPVETARAPDRTPANPVAAPAAVTPPPAPVAVPAPAVAATPSAAATTPVEPKKMAEAPAPAVRVPAQPVAGTIADFDQPGAWKLADGVWRHRGPGFYSYKLPANGVFNFDVQAVRGGRARWTVDYANSLNYTLFELSEERLEVFEIAKGNKSSRRKASHGIIGKVKQWTMQVDVSPERVTHSILRNKAWVLLDTWTQPGRNFSGGKFGFLVLGNDEIGLADFRYKPR